ncbi:hypothetical protein ERC79_09120 [Rhodococcus sp. ABRD24]|uniref:DUF5947 family protein n=1 Tax=Rhodococcus sp. ABRD24 TaxID=2507582 RepID=UPI001039643A|nr:DUF5947 family protein [Rhodococcus sp. ABRD24]QBJ96117.1 hypothetical protein ERC79_09120 [Rhodococcus sp. ABRD24]
MSTPPGRGTPSGAPLGVLRRIASDRPEAPAGERCEMCAAPIADEHSHVVNMEGRQLICVCRPCYLLFTEPGARLRYRAVPQRFLSFPEFALSPGQWDQLEIPVGLAFFFRNSDQDRTVAFYPGPAGATESELPIEAWESVLIDNPALRNAVPDVEALLIRVPSNGVGSAECHLLPIDACYELVGRLRRCWRGFDGGQDARRELDAFFDRIDRRSIAVSATGGRTGGAP